MIGQNSRRAEGKGSCVSALLDFVEDGQDRVDADLLVIDYFRQNYGIWKKTATLDEKACHRTASMREMIRRRKIELELIAS